jgi:PAS domain S-box-containing protein
MAAYRYFQRLQQALQNLIAGRAASKYSQGDFYDEETMPPERRQADDWHDPRLQDLLGELEERKQIEAQLRTSEAYYRALIESQVDLISRYLPDSTLTFVNDAYCQFYGKTREELIGHSYLSMVAPEFRGQTLKNIESMVKNPAPISGEFLNYKRDGEECWIQWVVQGITDEHGRVVELQAIGRDITRLKQSELTLRQSEEDYRDLYENAPNGYFSVDTHGIIGRCNRYLVQMLGYSSADQIVGAPVAELYADTPHGKSKVLRIFEDVRAGGAIRDEELQMQKRDGTPVWVSLTTNAERDGEGQFRWTRSLVVNITERKRAEAELRRLNEELEQRVDERTAKLAAANQELESFAYSVSHDLRAPLRAIDGYTRILLEDYQAALDMEGQRICAVIRNETQRMGQLIDDLLAFSRMGRMAMQMAPVDMAALARTAFDALCAPDDQARVAFDLAPLPAALGDPSLLRQVWTNLLGNALKFSAKRQRATIEVGCREEGEETIYWVRDNGAGFDMRYVDKLFGVFQRLHSEREFAGAGVGLAIVQRVISRHGGRVWAESVVDQGATFYFALPRRKALDMGA